MALSEIGEGARRAGVAIKPETLTSSTLVGHGFIRAGWSVFDVFGKHECLPYGPHGHPCVD